MSKYTRFNAYVQAHQLNPNRYEATQRVAVNAVLLFLEGVDFDRWYTRVMVYFLAQGEFGLSTADISRLTRYSEDQVRAIGKEAPEVFKRVYRKPRGGGRPVWAAPKVAADLVALVVKERVTRPRELKKRLEPLHGPVSRKTISNALVALGLKPICDEIEAARQTPMVGTRYAGVWLLAPFIVGMYEAAKKAFGNEDRVLRRILTLVAMSLGGIARVFHLPDIQDAGLAVFTGGAKLPSRQEMGGWLRRVKRSAVERFCRLTEDVRSYVGRSVRLSLDDHVIARWTRLFAISKGYHTIRNKHMKVERMYYFYDLDRQELTHLVSGSGKDEMSGIMGRLVSDFRSLFRPKEVTLLIDAAASKKNEELVSLLKGKERVIVRAPRWPHLMKQWRALPAERFEKHWESSEEKGKKKLLKVAETRTMVKGESVRTIVAVEGRPGKKKERWHVLYTNDEDSSAYDLIEEFRERQNHEQSYRVLVHDLNLDALPNGYRWWSSDRRRPGFEPKRLQLVGWIKGLVYNAIQKWKKRLPEPYRRMMPFSLMRVFLFRPGRVRLTKEAVQVEIDEFRELKELDQYVSWLNRERVRIPWLGDRRLVVRATKPTDEFFPRLALNSNRC